MRFQPLVRAAALLLVAAVTSPDLAAAQSAPPPVPALPASDEPITLAADGKRKINLSGRQRMLSQYMAKAVCFANLGVDEASQVNDLKFTYDLFNTTLNELRDGSTVQRMLPEDSEVIQDALDVVQLHWQTYGPAVKARDLATVAAVNGKVLTTMNDAVTLFQKKYGSGGTVSPEIAAALNISGRQRMLTQKSSKEFCLIASGKDVDANRAALKATIELFEKSMNGLKLGDDGMGLKAAPLPEITAQIEKASEEWSQIRPILMKTAEGAAPSKEEVASVSQRNVPIMWAMNQIVELYERLTK